MGIQIVLILFYNRLQDMVERLYTERFLDYIYFHNKQHPQDLGVEEIRTYLSHLATDKKIAASTQNIALSALLFQKSSRWMRKS